MVKIGWWETSLGGEPKCKGDTYGKWQRYPASAAVKIDFLPAQQAGDLPALAIHIPGVLLNLAIHLT
ncbi:hypothetical protein [Microbulbifer discodermiae]|uniref:hypothetical protein n=1 Tax=Microbulbifer sp. 2201CG32-9 TaxID=3232309 RepID=UPI00345C2332